MSQPPGKPHIAEFYDCFALTLCLAVLGFLFLKKDIRKLLGDLLPQIGRNILAIEFLQFGLKQRLNRGVILRGCFIECIILERFQPQVNLRASRHTAFSFQFNAAISESGV